MARLKSDQEFYEEKSWGSVAIAEGKDLPTLKLRRLLRALPKKGKVLEVGCGSGRILASVRKHRPDLQLTGVDISEQQLALARRDNPDITFLRASGERLPFKDGSFDAVFFLDVIEHVDHPDVLMRDAIRVLKHGGTFHCFSPAEGRGIYRLSACLLRRHIKEITAGHIQRYTHKQLEDLITWNECAITRTEYSYHLLGSIMDYALFTLLLHKGFARLFWGRNKYYRNAQTQQSFLSRVMNALLSLANGLAYYESLVLGRVRWLSTGIHLTARKK